MLKKNQQGIGLLEVLVALLLLAVAVLGFSAMQMRAIKATDETLFRSDAMVAVRNIAEDMRLYPSNDQKQKYKDYIQTQPTKQPKDCRKEKCTSDEQMRHNAFESIRLARDSQITLNAYDCPGINASATNTLKKICLVASWGDTEAVMADNSDTACIDSSGVYRRGATCFVMETY